MHVNIKSILSNKAIRYVISRYATYIIQFINSIFIAVYLGPYYLGVWGFINLVINYIMEFNLGIPNSVNNIVSINIRKENYCKIIIGNGFSLIIVLLLIIILSFSIIIGLNINTGDKYNFSKFIIPVIIISCFTHLNSYFSNIFRIYGKIFAIVTNQSLFPILLLPVIFIFKGENLLWTAVITNCLAVVSAFILFLIQMPVKIKFVFNNNISRYILKKGWYLFVYTASFILIMLSTRSFISAFYVVSNFGLFTFSYSLSNAVLLLLNSISFLILPKMLNRLAHSDEKYVKSLIKDTRAGYISLSHGLIHCVIMIYPMFIYFLPEYKDTLSVFRLISLTVALYTNSFGYQILITSKEKEKLLAIIGFSSLLLNVFLLFVFISLINVSFEYAILATMFTYFIYSLVIGFFGRQILYNPTSLRKLFSDIYPIGIIIPFIISLFLCLINGSNILFCIPFILYLILNKNDLERVKKIVTKIIINPKFIDL